MASRRSPVRARLAPLSDPPRPPKSYGFAVEGVRPLRLRGTNGTLVEALLISSSEQFGPRERAVNETTEHVVDFLRLREVRGPVHVAALPASNIAGLRQDDSLPLDEIVLHPFEVGRLREWLESPFAESDGLV